MNTPPLHGQAMLRMPHNLEAMLASNTSGIQYYMDRQCKRAMKMSEISPNQSRRAQCCHGHGLYMDRQCRCNAIIGRYMDRQCRNVRRGAVPIEWQYYLASATGVGNGPTCCIRRTRKRTRSTKLALKMLHGQAMQQTCGQAMQQT